MTTYGDDDLVVVLLGDHQPATIVSGEDAATTCRSRSSPATRPCSTAIAGWAWDAGLRPGPDAPVWRMDAFRDRFLAAYAGGARLGPTVRTVNPSRRRHV